MLTLLQAFLYGTICTVIFVLYLFAVRILRPRARWDNEIPDPEQMELTVKGTHAATK